MGAACIKRCLLAIKKGFFGLPQRTLLPSRWTTVSRSVLSLHVQQSPLRIPLNPQNVQKLCRIVVNFHRCALNCKKRRKHDGFSGIAWAQLAALLKKKTSTKNRINITVNHLKLYWSCKTHTWINRIFPRNTASQWGRSLCLLQKNSGKRQRKRSPRLIDENPVTQQISFFVGRPIGAPDLPEDDRPAEAHLSFLSKQKLALPPRSTSLHTHQPPHRHSEDIRQDIKKTLFTMVSALGEDQLARRVGFGAEAIDVSRWEQLKVILLFLEACRRDEEYTNLPEVLPRNLETSVLYVKSL